MIKDTDNPEIIFELLNNKMIFNLFLPELLEIKRHYNNISFFKIQKKADNIINMLLDFLENNNFYE